MRVDDPKGRLLALEMDEDADEKDVLHHVGEVAGMEGVAVVHGKPGGPSARARLYQGRAILQAGLNAQFRSSPWTQNSTPQVMLIMPRSSRTE